MKENRLLSKNTAEYLSQYYCILKEMIAKMTEAELTQSISANFITQMIPHHRAAIEMSENLLQYTTDIPLQNIALDIISEQTKSIENMTEVYPSCRELANSACDLEAYGCKNRTIIDTMFREMECAYSNNSINQNFMREMIPHHMGAVRLSENALQYPICPELVPILEAIIVSQKRGIRQMCRLLSRSECR